jgi:hypothetical protein
MDSLDEAAVAALEGGDRERFRELSRELAELQARRSELQALPPPATPESAYSAKLARALETRGRTMVGVMCESCERAGRRKVRVAVIVESQVGPVFVSGRRLDELAISITEVKDYATALGVGIGRRSQPTGIVPVLLRVPISGRPKGRDTLHAWCRDHGNLTTNESEAQAAAEAFGTDGRPRSIAAR